jgi:hypothetical protein
MTTPLPTIHLNGTSRETLAEGYDAAEDALYDLIQAFGGIEFNARDYYVQGPTAWTAAVEARQEINRKIRDIREYIHAHRELLHS